MNLFPVNFQKPLGEKPLMPMPMVIGLKKCSVKVVSTYEIRNETEEGAEKPTGR